MAYIREFRQGKWRAEIQKNGTRASKVFPSRPEAEAWAKSIEELADISAARLRLQSSIVHDVSKPILMSALPFRVLDAIQRVPYSHSSIVSASFTTGSGIGVYFLTLRGEVVYVGQTIDIFARLHRHKRDSEKSFDGFSFIQCKEEDLDLIESLYIDAFLPMYNRSTGFPDRHAKTA